ncbi:hypothetical protein U0C82_15310 [Fulvimarina sp. 2208YS6-2-32]|uniref:HPr kinase/phosphorylase C-terminal domain-containing protein n=1 Tax=Fulvimarina uroteuthidis TaxID=3098149 RepID=A0ABU5I556_9HYPH|nr:hypothetical protein [Fulvimarina sp. 2208YS6-2-32]MDY8110509.1 hypothetical protein [Fulvimarina sp. 2208YS6-2-32]
MGENIHGTALRVGSYGILIRGAARSGKSSLCISLLRRAASLSLDAGLISDDRVDLKRCEANVIMSAPPVLMGLIEISGVGIIRETPTAPAALSLIVDLVAAEDLMRLPEKTMQECELLGRAIRRIAVPRRDAAFTADVILSLLTDDNLQVR